MLLFEFLGKLHEINQISSVLAFLDTVFESNIRLCLLEALFRHKSSKQIEITIHF